MARRAAIGYCAGHRCRRGAVLSKQSVLVQDCRSNGTRPGGFQQGSHCKTWIRPQTRPYSADAPVLRSKFNSRASVEKVIIRS